MAALALGPPSPTSGGFFLDQSISHSAIRDKCEASLQSQVLELRFSGDRDDNLVLHIHCDHLLLFFNDL